MMHPYRNQPPRQSNTPFWVLFVAMVAVIIILLVLVLAREHQWRNRVLDPTEVPVVIRGEIPIAPTPTRGPVPTPVGVVRSARVGAVLLWKRRVSRLETQDYRVVADDIQKRDPVFLEIFGGELIQSHVEGSVIGRTDLSDMTITPKLREGDIVISEDGKSIWITLPAPEITRPIIDEEVSSFNNHKLGYFAKVDPNLWQKSRIEVNKQLVAKACEDGILEETRIEAERQIQAIFGLGFDHVYVVTRASTSPCGMVSN